jgi:hypothetical protein
MRHFEVIRLKSDLSIEGGVNHGPLQGVLPMTCNNAKTKLARVSLHAVSRGGEDMGDVPEPGVGLADAVEMLRAELLEAQEKASQSKIQFPIRSLTFELKVVATRSANGKAGFRVPFVNAELGAATQAQREATQTVTVEFGSPVNERGEPINVAAISNQLKN